MLTTLEATVAALSPILLIVALLVLAERRNRLREATIARQIRLTGFARCAAHS